MTTLRGGLARLRASLLASIGDVTFGMEDGAVSIAGLVFGVAASTNDARIVVLAGATGAVAGAVSMMAGTYLDVHSERSLAAAQVADARVALAADPEDTLVRVDARLREAGFTPEETGATVTGLRRNPEALLAYVAAFELGVQMKTESSPRAHALWMFVADLFAAGVPVMPFLLFPIDTARIVSLVVTGALMAALGVARGRIGRESVYRTALQTMGIAGAAALAGVLIGRLVTA
ncbi:MAG TPA: VIT1/CCC1 transporter family protein [Candidatus Limnocylindrales bacterium]|nr:VIT1/CCC1 transporter family protein [Candidatus Limnocylindrales bacterium]